MALIKGLGMTSYRVPIHDISQFDSLSALIASARKYNLDVLAIILPDLVMDQETEASAYHKAFVLASSVVQKFKNDIHVWEIANEAEQYALVRPGEKMDDGSIWNRTWGDSAGDETRFYIGARYNRVRGLIQGLCDGVSSVDRGALRIVNVASGLHYAFFQRLLSDGTKFEITGCHWYSQMGDIENASNGSGIGQNVARALAGLGKPIWISECDRAEGSSDGDENAQANSLAALVGKFIQISFVYNIKAIYVYELLDEPYLGRDNFESYMGLVHSTQDKSGSWQIGSPKPAYDTLLNLVKSVAGPPPPGGNASRLINLSTRSYVGSNDTVLIAGFIIGGTQPKSVLIRASGPALTQYGVSGVLADPVLTLYSGSTQLGQNDDWGSDMANITAATAAIGAVPFAAASKDSAIAVTLSPGPYTAIVSGKNASAGVALVEVFEADGPTSAPRLINISSRSLVLTSDHAQIAGFIISGITPKKVLIRASGPALAQYLSGSLADPVLTLFSNSTQIGYDDDWGADAANVTAFTDATNAVGFPNGSKDAALAVTLDPGAYTAMVTGKGGSTGIALIEVFEVP